MHYEIRSNASVVCLHWLFGLAIVLVVSVCAASYYLAKPNANMVEAEQQNQRYVILIQGLTSVGVQNCENPTGDFADWRDSVQGALGLSDENILAVSYTNEYCPGKTFQYPTYTAMDTCNGIDTVVEQIRIAINSVAQDAQFDIIGHSLGGFIAAYLLVPEAKLRPVLQQGWVRNSEDPVLGLALEFRAPVDLMRERLISEALRKY